MSFNPFAHFDELVFTNVDGGPLLGMPIRDKVHLPDGQDIAAAVPFHPETITHWIMEPDHAYHQITGEQAFAQNLWLHFAYGADISPQTPDAIHALGFVESTLGNHFTITAQGLMNAIETMPTHLADILTQYTAQQIVDYAVYEAPDVVLVGQPPIA